MGKDHLDEEKVLLIAEGKTELKIIGMDKAIWRQHSALIASSERKGGAWVVGCIPPGGCCRGGREPVTGTKHHELGE